MNAYGLLAKAFWETYRPEATAELPDPDAFFTDLGEQIAQQITDTFQDLAGEATPGQDFMDRLGELNMGRLRAREAALQELVYCQAKEPGTEDLEMPYVALPKIAATLE